MTDICRGVYESERVHCSVMSHQCDSMDCSMASLSMKFFRQEYWLGSLFFLSLTVQINNCLCVCLIL